MTTIRYFLPEDGDTESYPNVFLAPKPRHQGAPPTLGQVKDAFPLPGRYHFRFKAPLVPGADREKGGMAVWMDCTSDNQPVSTWRNSIVAKVTRISMEDDEESDEEFERHRAPAPAPVTNNRTPAPPQRAPAPAPKPSEPLLDVFDSHNHSANHSRAASNASSNTGNLLDVPVAAAVSGATPAAPSSGGSLLDMDNFGGHHSHQPQPNNSHAHADFLGMTAPAPAAATPSHHYHSQQQQQQPRPTPQQQPQNGYSATTPSQQNGYRPQQQPPQNGVPRAPSSGNNNAFDSFSTNQGPFGGLQWGK